VHVDERLYLFVHNDPVIETNELVRANHGNARARNPALGTASRLRTVRQCEPKLTYSNSTSKRLARLVALSRSTQGSGFASLFQLSTPDSLSVMDATAQLCHPSLWDLESPVRTPTSDFRPLPADFRLPTTDFRTRVSQNKS